ncbi:MAG: MscL family protein [Candidatus Lokiarchaeota archaeon]
MLQEFKQFLNKYKVMGLAVAFIMGIYLGDLVQSLVNNLIMPIVEFFTPSGVNWQQIMIGPFGIGAFIGELITFIIIALVIFLLVKLTKRIGIE